MQNKTDAIPAVYATAESNALLGFFDQLPTPLEASRQLDGVPLIARSDRDGNIEVTVSEP